MSKPDPIAELLLRYLFWVFLVLRTLTVLLAIAVAAAVIVLIYQAVIQGADITTALGLVGAAATGVASVYLGRQAAKAKKELDDARGKKKA